MRLPCDLEVHVNGEQIFLLSKEVLLPRCGRLLREYRTALKAYRRSKEGGITSVRMLLQDVPGGAKAFELVARFCYKGGWIEMGPDNVALMRCAAAYLEMSEDYGVGNLLQHTDAFLSTIAVWSWKDILTLLTSCESLLPFAEKCGIIQLCVDSLATLVKYHESFPSPSLSSRSSPSPCSISPTAKPSLLKPTRRSPKINQTSAPQYFSRKLLNPNQSPSCPCSPDPCRTPISHPNSPSNRCNLKHNWWSEDTSSLSMYMMERVVTALQTHRVDNRHISKVLLRYLEASLPLLGYSSLTISKEKAGTDQNTLKDYAQRVQREVLETIVCLLHELERASVPVKSLFELRRVSIAMSASHPCSRQIEEMIGSQLHKATLDNILISRVNGRDRRSCLYDVDLVLRLLKCFLRGEAVAKRQAGSVPNDDLDPVAELDLRYSYGGELDSAPLRMVGTLIDKYLAEIAPDSFLKPSKFSELAEALPSIARDTHDGLYKALDIYLQAHPRIPAEDAMRVCRAIDFKKLSFEACKHVMENPRIPPLFSFRVLASQQEKLRAALGSGTACSRRTSSEDVNPCPAITTEYASVVRQNEELRSDLRNMQAKVNELERLCKGLRSQMSQEVTWLSC